MTTLKSRTVCRWKKISIRRLGICDWAHGAGTILDRVQTLAQTED